MPTTSPRASTSGPPELPGLMAASVWMNCPGLRASSREGFGRFSALTMPRVTVKRNPNGLPKASTVCPGMQLGGIAPRNAGEVLAFDLDHGQIGQRIGADHLGGQHAAIVHGHANVDRAIHHVVVGDDVAIGRNDDAAADAVLDLRALLLLPEVEAWAEELPHVVGNLGLRLLVGLGFWR